MAPDKKKYRERFVASEKPDQNCYVEHQDKGRRSRGETISAHMGDTPSLQRSQLKIPRSVTLSSLLSSKYVPAINGMENGGVLSIHWKKHKTSKYVFSRLRILHSVKQRVSCTLHPVKVTLALWSEEG